MAKATTYKLTDCTKEEAKAKGKVFYDAWVEHNKLQLRKAFEKREKEKVKGS